MSSKDSMTPEERQNTERSLRKIAEAVNFMLNGPGVTDDSANYRFIVIIGTDKDIVARADSVAYIGNGKTTADLAHLMGTALSKLGEIVGHDA